MLQSATILGFSRAVSQPVFDRLICFGFSLLYFGGMGALVVAALCAEAVRDAALLFVAMPSGFLAVLVLSGSRFLRIAEQRVDKAAQVARPEVSDSRIGESRRADEGFMMIVATKNSRKGKGGL